MLVSCHVLPKTGNNLAETGGAFVYKFDVVGSNPIEHW